MLYRTSSLMHSRKGLSLVEIMIAMVMTLIVLGAMMAAFSYGSAEMQLGRASIELNNRLITVEEQLRRDLDRITVELKPHHDLPALPKGYVEIVDGPQTDFVAANVAGFNHGGNELLYGDRDDFFAFTIMSDGKPFKGRFGNQIVESHLAEVAWFTVFDPGTLTNKLGEGVNPDVLLVRRQLLVLPDLDLNSIGVVNYDPTNYDQFLQNNDVSVRRSGSGLVANSLTDLAIRGNRFSHNGFAATNPQSSLLEILELGERYSDDHVMQSRIAAFDVQVFAPDASNLVFLDAAGADIIDVAEPSDIGLQAGGTTGSPAAISGAYVDLGKSTGNFGSASHYRFGYDLALPAPHLVNPPLTPSDPAIPTVIAYDVYDTGSSQYNRNIGNDAGANGVDDNGDNAIDDPGEFNRATGIVVRPSERDAVAPYSRPIRGVKFTIRVLEPNTNQVRQLSVRKSFVDQ